MGTVGLSFGSPTSGTGFDVSSTVQTITSNLRNVETPWKNQLTKLQDQDTVISSLGTLFSNLSTDMSTLTDFQGVLAQKTGSSSDTSVLDLTSASSSATAGTHSVVVNSLAKTASGYLAPISNAADTICGSITLNVGTGTAKTINMSALTNQTLGGLAAAINSSGAGVVASVLTDSSGSRLSLVSGTSGGAGNITVSSNTIADATASSAALAYTSSATGIDASLTVDGVNLTSASNTVSNLIPGITFQLLSKSAAGSEVQVIIGNDNSSVESAVNTLVKDYNSLMTAINAQEGNDSSGNPEPLFGSPTVSLLQQQLLGGLNTQNPNGYLDPIAHVADSLSGSISIQVGNGTAQIINVGDSSTPATLAGLASAINAAAIGATANVVTNSSGSQLELLSNTTGAAGALTVSSSITDTTTSKTLAYNDGGSHLSSLTSLGISVNNDGTLTFDANALDSLLNTDFSSVVGFFQNANSWGGTFSNLLTNAGASSSSGILKLAQTANSNIESALNAEISKQEALITTQQKSLTAELTTANQILQSLPSQLQGVNEIYAAVTGYGQNSNG
jgi:flagellar hook-associated protein 2